jgi:hypothetical protein
MSDYRPEFVNEDQPATSTATRERWAIMDANGTLVIDGLPSRAFAIRRMGYLAKSTSMLPLRVIDPHGDPTGDMIG